MKQALVILLALLPLLALVADAQQPAMAGKYAITLTSAPNPTVAGDNVFTILVKDGATPLVGGVVTIRADMPGMSMPSDFTTTPGTAPGEYIGKVYLGMVGQWKITVKVQQKAAVVMDGDGQTDYMVTATRITTVTMPPLPRQPVQQSRISNALWYILGGLPVLLLILLVVGKRQFGKD
jgi:hypothetical protein